MLRPRKPSSTGRRGLRNKIGELGETLAADFLIGKGYEILARNLQYSFGEIDILARKGEVVVIVEVKTRSQASAAFDPRLAVLAKRRKALALMSVISDRYPEHEIRFDCVCVLEGLGTSEWHRNVFS